MLQRTSTTLREYFLEVAIFDKSQMLTRLKHQRNGASSSSTIVTSRCFILPTVPCDIDLRVFQNTFVEIIYINQPIPSPPEMMEFEKLNSNSLASFLINSEQSVNDVNMSGDLVKAHARMVTLSSTVSNFYKIISREFMQFAFTNSDHNEAMETLHLKEHLKANKTRPFAQDG